MATFDQYTDIFPTGSSNGGAIPITGISIGGANILHSNGASEICKIWGYAINNGITNGVIAVRTNGNEDYYDIPAKTRMNIFGPDQILRYGCTLTAWAYSGVSAFSVMIRVKGATTISTY